MKTENLNQELTQAKKIMETVEALAELCPDETTKKHVEDLRKAYADYENHVKELEKILKEARSRV